MKFYQFSPKSQYIFSVEKIIEFYAGKYSQNSELLLAFAAGKILHVLTVQFSVRKTHGFRVIYTSHLRAHCLNNRVTFIQKALFYALFF